MKTTLCRRLRPVSPRHGAFALDIINRGTAGAALTVYAPQGAGPWFYTVEAGHRLSDRLALGERYSFQVHGPNGLLRDFHDAVPFTAITSEIRFDGAGGQLVLVVRNSGDQSREVVTQPLRYLGQSRPTIAWPPGTS